MSAYKPTYYEEYDIFYGNLCIHCSNDIEFRRTGKNGCEIFARAQVYDIDQDEYPSEWVIINDMPFCVAFKTNVVSFDH